MAGAWEVRKRLGGGMRQSGILAAGALHGLEHHRTRLAEDHHHARQLAERIDGAGGASVVAPESNIVMLDLPDGIDAREIVAAAAGKDVRLTPWSLSRIRAVTHLDVDTAMVGRAAETICDLLERASGASTLA